MNQAVEREVWSAWSAWSDGERSRISMLEGRSDYTEDFKEGRGGAVTPLRVPSTPPLSARNC